jgi:hypothetical protein
MAHGQYYLGFIAYEGDDYKATNTLMKFQEKKNTKRKLSLSSRYEQVR